MASVAPSLKDILLDPARRPAVVADLQTLVDEEVADKNGVSGAVIKTGYATVKKLKPGVVSTAVDRMLPDFTGALEQYFADYRGNPGGDFGDYLSGRPEAADVLLGVTDARADRSNSDALKSVYRKLRPHGQKNVADALPRLGRLIEKHATV